MAVLADERIVPVETGACPHTAIRDDISANLDAVEQLEAANAPVELTLVESGGDNLTAIFSRALVDRQIFVIDVAGGDKVPRKGGPGVTTADLLVINKTDLAPLRQRRSRCDGPRCQGAARRRCRSRSPRSSNPAGARGRRRVGTRPADRLARPPRRADRDR